MIRNTNGDHRMNTPILLQVDLRKNKSNLHECAKLSNRFKQNILEEESKLIDYVNNLSPDVICFEFDYPDFKCLKTLELTKKSFPSIPIIMITEHHDENLAIWALRARVWDYLVKPVDCEIFYSYICKLTDLRSNRNYNSSSRDILQPSQTISKQFNTGQFSDKKNTSLHVIRYVEDHYQEKIYISELAEKCKISKHQFGRVFKREKGITFREYLVNFRLDKARELLEESQLSVGDVSFAVGFFDHSYFTRMFKRYAGLSPSDYRLRNQ